MYSFKKVMLFLFIFSLSCVFLSCDEETENPVNSPDPTVSITSPTNNQTVSDYVTITATANDDVGVAKVEFYIDAQLLQIDAAVPYEVYWNSGSYEHGTNHSIYAVVYDTDENSTGSEVVTVQIDTSLGIPESPVVTITDSLVTTEQIPIVWNKSNESDFDRYSIFIDTTDTGEPSILQQHIVSANDTTFLFENLLDNTTYRIQVEVSDIFGKKSKSNIVSTTTINAPPPQGTFLLISNSTDIITFSWNQVPISDFSYYSIVRSTDSIYQLTDLEIVQITDYATLSYEYSTTDTNSYYYFLLIIDESNEYSISEPYFNNREANYALNFNGSTYATVPYFAGLNLGDNYTLEAWVYQRTASSYDRVIDKSPPDSPYLQYSLISGNYLGIDLCQNGNPGRYHATVGVTLNEWHHVGLSYEAGIITYFIDGQVVDYDSLGITTSCSFETTLNIGRRKLFNEFYFDGLIDEVRVWNVVRTPTEIGDNYNKKLAGTETGLVCYFQFNEGVGDGISSPVGGNGHLGESVGVDDKDPYWVVSTAPIQ